MDRDSAVFPYLNLHADINDVTVTTMEADFDDLTANYMKDVDIIIGADICFWDSMVGTLKTLILRALKSGVKTIIIADPGRTTFERLGQYFLDNRIGEIRNRDINHPYAIQGRILKISI
jgi:predicted nicotinamide N-methyase